MQANTLLVFIAHAAGVNLLLFAVAALAIRSHKKTELGWIRGLGLFVLTCAVTGFLYFLADDVSPGIIGGVEFTGPGMIVEFLFPLAVDVLILWFLWKPFSPDQMRG